MNLAFVNHRGEPISLERLAAQKRPMRSTSNAMKRTTDRGVAKASDGFAVAGYGPAQLEEAEREHRSAHDEQAGRIARGQSLARGERVLQAWNQETWMAGHKPKRVRTKPYEIESAADLCADLARKAGWVRVTVEELMKA